MIIGYSGYNQPMKAVGIIGIILIAVFVIVMLMTFAFHLIVFKLLLVTRETSISNLDRNEIASGILEQAWTI
jgi:hypothetical protein